MMPVRRTIASTQAQRCSFCVPWKVSAAAPGRAWTARPANGAVTGGPRRLLVENLARAGMTDGCWLLELGVENGTELARHTLNPRLGVEGGISILGSTGLVRPYSHAAYVETVRLCVRARQRSGGREMVFCTGGRTQAGARRQLPHWPESAFVCIGDFIADSLGIAARHRMQEVVVACMAGKLCKYAAGLRQHPRPSGGAGHGPAAPSGAGLPARRDRSARGPASQCVRARGPALHPRSRRQPVLHGLARAALEHFSRRAPGVPSLHLLVFDFDGTFLFKESLRHAPGTVAAPLPSPDDGTTDSPEDTSSDGQAPDIGLRYFIDRP